MDKNCSIALPAAEYGSFDIAPGGERFLLVRNPYDSQQVSITLNWFEELKARVPVP